MYNSIYPININYSKPNQYHKKNDTENSSSQNTQLQNSNEQSQTFPNGTKVAIDYTKGQINISQVIADFKSTLIAINAPKEIMDEVGVYIGLVEKESLKDDPSKEIIVSNLKNASRISDSYIAKSLNKPSNVVEGWINALFLQKINLKANPDEVNPDFLLQFPAQAQEKIDNAKKEQVETQDEMQLDQVQEEIIKDVDNDEKIEIQSAIELSQETSNEIKIEPLKSETKSPFLPLNETDKQAKDLFSKAKKTSNDNKGDTEALNYLNEALGLLQNSKDANSNIKAAIHFERAKIFDSYDYVDYALRDYFEATKAQDFNLKAQAFYKSGQIYDEFSEFAPALDNYLSGVAYSGEADNISGQTQILSKIASLFSKKFDINNTKEYSNLAVEIALNTSDSQLIAKTYSDSAQNFQYIGENDSAIENYKNALSAFSRNDENYEQMAYNYEQAAIVMRKLGNYAKASKLQLKANLYYSKAQLQQNQMEQAS